MAAGDINDPLSEIPGVALEDRVSSAGAPGAGFGLIESINGVLSYRFGTGDAVPLVSLVAGLLSALTEKEAPASGDWLLLQDTADGDALKKVDVANLPGGTPAPGGLYDAYLYYRNEQAQNTAGGTFTSGAWQTRVLNTEVADTAGIGALSSNQVTLPAGTYRVQARCPAAYVNANQARLYNVTGAAVLVLGPSCYAGYDGDDVSEAFVTGRFTLAVESAVRLEHRCQTTRNGNGFGVQSNFTTEIYAELELWRETE